MQKKIHFTDGLSEIRTVQFSSEIMGHVFISFRYVDMLNLMTYDMHGGSFDDKTGHNAPLKAHPSETGNQTYFNVVRLIIKKGIILFKKFSF